MKRALNLFLRLPVFGPLLLSTASSSKVDGHATDETIASRTAEIDCVKLHYMTAGGTRLILLRGYAETSRMWKPIIPVLAGRFTVIAPDLPGIGDSDIPADGLDMKSAAIRIHDLAKSLGVEKAEVVGHDIGLIVAYAYAAQFPAQVTKLVLMDAFLPGVGGWEAVYNNPSLWHFRFNGPTPEALIQGRERAYFEYFWNDFAADKTHSIAKPTRRLARGRDACHAGWAYFVSFERAAKYFAQLSQTKLTMPVLTIGGEKSLGEPLAQQTKLVATDVIAVVLKDTGHWVLEGRPKDTTEALQKFLTAVAKLECVLSHEILNRRNGSNCSSCIPASCPAASNTYSQFPKRVLPHFPHSLPQSMIGKGRAEAVVGPDLGQAPLGIPRDPPVPAGPGRARPPWSSTRHRALCSPFR